VFGDYYDLGISHFLIRGFDPLIDAIEYGRELIPLTRKLIAERQAAKEVAPNDAGLANGVAPVLRGMVRGSPDTCLRRRRTVRTPWKIAVSLNSRARRHPMNSVAQCAIWSARSV
jgi:hypothetical protein